MHVAFRTDGNSKTGIGHVMRCLSLAKELSKKADITFILSDESKDIKSFIEDSLGCGRVYVIPDVGYGYVHEEIFMPEHSLEDAKHSKSIIKGIGEVDFLVIDHYGIEKQWELELAPYVKNIMVIDDLANRLHECDILLDQNFYLDAMSRYDGLVPDGCVKLLGAGYALLREEFLYAKNAIIRQNVENILVSFGGSDTNNFTSKVLDVLKDKQYRKIKINVVMGSASIHKDEVKYICDENANFEYFEQINFIAKLMSRSDIFIGAGGSTSWERMALGLPSIIFSIAENQTKICEDLAAKDLVKYAGVEDEYSLGAFQACLNEVIEDKKWREFSAINGRKIVDARGTKKVAAHILSQKIKIQKAITDDCEKIYNWLRVDFNQLALREDVDSDFESCIKFVEATISDNNSDLIIASRLNVEVGFARFDYKDDLAFISLYINPICYNEGMGLSILISVIDWLKKNYSTVEKVEAEIRNDNETAKQVFADAGFYVISPSYKKHTWQKDL